MFVTNTSNFIDNPVLEMDINCPTDEVELFGKKYRMHKDEWKKHIHLKCTNKCDARCSFCIERDSCRDPEDSFMFLESANELLRQMNDQRQLKTVSITGGEPTIFSRINDTIQTVYQYPVKLFSMNTNGRNVYAGLRKGIFRGWINISKHAIHDSLIFARQFEVSPDTLWSIRRCQPMANIRLQCVLGAKNGLETMKDIWDFIRHYNDYTDDFSFRSMIVDKDGDYVPQLFWDFRKFLFDSGWCIEQTIQDYYVYEVFRPTGGTKQITISWSNMNLLRKYNESHDDNFLEEIIVHPDGIISGSWNKKSLVIYRP